MISLARFVLFNLLWLTTARFALTDYVFVILSISLILFSMELKKNSPKMRAVMYFVLLAGMLFDLFAHTIHLVEFFEATQYFIPVWLITMWFLFAWIVPDLLMKFAKRRIVLILASAFFGPLSYFWGVGFQILRIEGYSFYFCYAAFWAALMWLTHRYLYSHALPTTSMAMSE